MPEINQIQSLLPQAAASGAQIPWDVKQRMMADQLAMQTAAAPKAPYTSKTAGMLSALTGGLGGLLNGMEQQKVMQGQADSRQQMLALADALHPQGGSPVAAPGAAPASAPVGQGGVGSDHVSSNNPAGYDPKATEALIRARAPAFGISPDAAVAIARSEGLNKYGGDNGSSYGPFQLHYGNVAGGGNAVGGLGDTFTKQTGLDARDPSTVPQQIDFALKNAAQGGWGPWHGRKTAGMGEWDGIGQAPKASAASADMPAANAQPVSMAGLPPGVTPAMFAASQNAGGPTDGNALRRGDEAPAGTKPFVSGTGPQPGAAPAPAPAPQSDGSVRGDLLASALTHGVDVGQPAIVPAPVGDAMPPSNEGLAGPQSDAAMGNDAPQSDLRADLLSAMSRGDTAQPAVVPAPVGDNMPALPPDAPNAALAGPQSDAAMGNAAPVPTPAMAPPAPPAAADAPSFDPEGTGAANYDPSAAPSLRDTIMAAASGGPQTYAAMGNSAPVSAPVAPPVAAGGPSFDPEGTGPANYDPTSAGAPPVPAVAPAGAGSPPPPPPAAGAGLPMMAAGNLPAPDMSAPAPAAPPASMASGNLPTPNMAPTGPQPGTGAALPQTGPMPPPGAQSIANAAADAPAPGASNAGPAPLTSPMAQALMSQPQPMGLAGRGGADPMSAQNFNKSQALVSALGGGSPAGGAQNPAQDGAQSIQAPQGGGMPGGGQPSPAPAGGGAPQSGGYSQARAFAAQILSNPYASPQAQEMAGKILMPQMQVVSGADGVTYGIDPVTRQVTKLFDGGAKFDANQSLLQGGRFNQAPAAPMDAAPGHNVITFGANNQPTSETPIAATPNFSPVQGTGLAMDATTGGTKAIPGGVNGTASLKIGGADVPVSTNTGPAGVSAKPLLGADGASPLAAVAPIAAAGAKIDADAAAQKEAATGQVHGAQTFVDETAKNATAASVHVNELQQLKALAAASPTGWQASAAKFAADHGWVTPNGDKVQSYDDFRAYLGTQLRQAGSGALRNSEMDKLSSTLGDTNQSPAARAAAIQRVQDGFARQGALGQVASDATVPDPVAKQAKIQAIQQTWQNADAAIQAGKDPALVKAKMQQAGVPVVGF